MRAILKDSITIYDQENDPIQFLKGEEVLVLHTFRHQNFNNLYAKGTGYVIFSQRLGEATTCMGNMLSLEKVEV